MEADELFMLFNKFIVASVELRHQIPSGVLEEFEEKSTAADSDQTLRCVPPPGGSNIAPSVTSADATTEDSSWKAALSDPTFGSDSLPSGTRPGRLPVSPTPSSVLSTASDDGAACAASAVPSAGLASGSLPAPASSQAVGERLSSGSAAWLLRPSRPPPPPPSSTAADRTEKYLPPMPAFLKVLTRRCSDVASTSTAAAGDANRGVLLPPLPEFLRPMLSKHAAPSIRDAVIDAGIRERLPPPPEFLRALTSRYRDTDTESSRSAVTVVARPETRPPTPPPAPLPVPTSRPGVDGGTLHRRSAGSASQQSATESSASSTAQLSLEAETAAPGRPLAAAATASSAVGESLADEAAVEPGVATHSGDMAALDSSATAKKTDGAHASTAAAVSPGRRTSASGTQLIRLTARAGHPGAPAFTPGAQRPRRTPVRAARKLLSRLKRALSCGRAPSVVA